MHQTRIAVSITALIVLLACGFPTAVRAQAPSQPAPSADALAAARELIQVTNAAAQFKAALPMLFQNLKAAIVQNRPELEKTYDAMVPILNQKAQARLAELTDVMAGIYARNFNADEIRDITAFFRSPAGQKFIQRQGSIVEQSLAAGQQFGREVASDVQQEMSRHAP